MITNKSVKRGCIGCLTILLYGIVLWRSPFVTAVFLSSRSLPLRFQ
ncbi:MAG: hypothetical protein HC775_06305 [Hyellaceae cyanobacterium CSU_1_1]|nr:hypothetical protein [Hyellaceae cyanobacterium CSU_1_1]